MLAFVLGFFLLGFVIVWLQTGSLHAALTVSAYVLPFVVCAGYFATRKGPASATERRLAGAWRVVRRVVCFTAAFVFAIGAAFAVVDSVRSASLASFGLAALLGALAAFVAWTGIYGSGILRLMSDDKPEHERRKARYGWK